MRTCYLKEMRIARYNIRHELPDAQRVWAKILNHIISCYFFTREIFMQLA